MTPYALSLVVPGLVLSGSVLIYLGLPVTGVLLPMGVIYFLTPLLNGLDPKPGRAVTTGRLGQPHPGHPSLDELATPSTRPTGSAGHELGQSQWLLIAAVPIQIGTLAVGIHTAQMLSGPLLLITWAIAVGLCAALYAINVAHELMHANRQWQRDLARILLASVCFPTFIAVHLRIHHRFVGTDDDFQSAPRGQSLYQFWWSALRGHIRIARSALQATHPDRREVVTTALGAVLLLTVVAVLWGGIGVLVFLVQSIAAVLKLEAVNYLQHYGLRRNSLDNRLERVNYHHTWSQNHRLTNHALFNLMHHADHHVHPDRAYAVLEHRPMSPAYPWDFSIMFMVAAWPWLFRAVVHPVLDGTAHTPSPLTHQFGEQ
ncbi:MAG: fatty acid desaturase [Pseudomonadota bacterium]